jgi:hypothetical protein
MRIHKPWWYCTRIVLLFLFSGLRWRISRVHLKTCPFCPRFELIWSHFFECEAVAPYLAAEFLSLELLFRYVRVGKWRDVFTVIGDVTRVWCDLLSMCVLDLEVVLSLSNLPWTRSRELPPKNPPHDLLGTVFAVEAAPTSDYHLWS